MENQDQIIIHSPQIENSKNLNSQHEKPLIINDSQESPKFPKEQIIKSGQKSPQKIDQDILQQPKFVQHEQYDTNKWNQIQNQHTQLSRIVGQTDNNINKDLISSAVNNQSQRFNFNSNNKLQQSYGYQPQTAFKSPQSPFQPQLGFSAINPFMFLNQMNQINTASGNFSNETEKIDISFVLFFMLIFKGMILFCYIFLPMIMIGYHHVYQSIILYSILDFWTIKNVSGRYMLGMRWWIEIDAAGEQRWVFECRMDNSQNTEKQFWAMQGFFTLSWAVLSLISLINGQFQMSICFVFAFLQSSFNIWAYRQCNKAKDQKLKIFLHKLQAEPKMMKSVKLTFDFNNKNTNNKSLQKQ